MQMPKSYKETRVSREFTPIELGGHYLVIKQVEELESRSGRPMIKVSFDTAENDTQPHYFTDAFKNDIRPGKKWPINGCTYILTEDQNGDCNRMFKGFTTAVEKSNPGFTVQWGDGFCGCFKNKLVGGIFREELGAYNGKETHQRKLQRFCANKKVSGAAIPDIYETAEHKAWIASGGANADNVDDEFMHIPDGLKDEDVPFN